MKNRIFFYSTRSNEAAQIVGITKISHGFYRKLDASLLVGTDNFGKVLFLVKNIQIQDIHRILKSKKIATHLPRPESISTNLN